MNTPRISVFPKCYFDALVSGEMSYAGWIADAATLGGDGVEHYDGFFRSFRDEDVAPIVDALGATGQVSSMLCFSPDFTHADAGERARQVARQRDAIDLTVRLGTSFCRTLSGQNFPGLSRADGIARTVDGLLRSIEYAERRGVTLCLENHYKDGVWRYPEFAQPEEIYLEILDRVDSPRLGVQYDPSNAIVGGYDPIRFLDRVLPRVVTMHASDRWLVPGATLAELRQSDGTLGYSDKLKHGEVGKGMIDYDAIFIRLARAGYTGWISVEDGMNGLDELRRSVEFLRRKTAEHYRAA
ncbi:MAG TPA: sugar phosphate isomerase/epimerase family protein [Vicinamibacterales bacterium]|nr:sugar phosphate isomerase/epimerase family protein [Vicinamibacterales bacterium]